MSSLSADLINALYTSGDETDNMLLPLVFRKSSYRVFKLFNSPTVDLIHHCPVGPSQVGVDRVGHSGCQHNRFRSNFSWLLIPLVIQLVNHLEVGNVSPIVLLDEVSAHLDNERRAALYDEICGLRVQAWMTGTEPELFSELKNKAQFIEVSTIDGVSELSIVN